MHFLHSRPRLPVAGGLVPDVMISMKGLEVLSFAECLQAARVAASDGIKVPFLHIGHLIANKKR